VPAGVRRLDAHALAEQRPCRLAEEDLACVGRVAQAGRALDDLGGEKLPTGLAACDDHLSGLDPRPERELLPAKLEGGAHGPESVVLVQRRNPEDGNEALVVLAARHRTAVASDRLRDCRRQLSLQRAESLRVEATGRVCEAEGGDGHRLPHLARWLLREFGGRRC
jgi:hypothetical protein